MSHFYLRREQKKGQIQASGRVSQIPLSTQHGHLEEGHFQEMIGAGYLQKVNPQGLWCRSPLCPVMLKSRSGLGWFVSLRQDPHYLVSPEFTTLPMMILKSHVSLRLVYMVLGIEHRAPCMRGKHSQLIYTHSPGAGSLFSLLLSLGFFEKTKWKLSIRK